MPGRLPVLVLPFLVVTLGVSDLAAQSATEGLIRAAAARLVINQPDYTCLQTIERFERRGEERNIRKLDKILLEVALIAGREMFCRPDLPSTEKCPDPLRNPLIPAVGCHIVTA